MSKQHIITWTDQNRTWRFHVYLTKDGGLTTSESKAVRLSRAEVNAFLLQIDGTPAWQQAGEGSFPQILEVV